MQKWDQPTAMSMLNSSLTRENAPLMTSCEKEVIKGAFSCNFLFVVIKEPERGFMYLSKGELSESS